MHHVTRWAVAATKCISHLLRARTLPGELDTIVAKRCLVFEVFLKGITAGPILAARDFSRRALQLHASQAVPTVARLDTQLRESHASDDVVGSIPARIAA